jgi:hypothetical protein
MPKIKKSEKEQKGKTGTAMLSIKQQSCYAHTQHLIIPEAESTLHTARRFTEKEFRKEKTKTSEAYSDYPLFILTHSIWQQSWHRHVFRLMNSKACTRP